MTASIEIAGPFKIEGKPYTITIASKMSASADGNTIDTKTSEPAESKTVAAKPVVEKEPAEEASVTAEDEPVSEMEPVEATAAAAVGEIEVPAEDKDGNWTVVSVVIGISAAAAGIAILKITKIL